MYLFLEIYNIYLHLVIFLKNVWSLTTTTPYFVMSLCIGRGIHSDISVYKHTCYI